MANFDIAFKRTVVAEGGYVNDPDDKGGETYMGICRKYYPNAAMWKVIDALTKNNLSKKYLNDQLKHNTIVQANVKAIYKNNYWDVFDLDNIPNQKIANEVFDDAVNRGVKSATKAIQHLIGMTVNGIISDELIYNLKEYK